MAGAAELPRPGVEVVQEFQTTAPTIVTPTLVPCNIAPFFEVIEALNGDGTLNDEALLEDAYEQLELVVPQSSFPSPRGNIDEVDVLEDSVRSFFDFGGSVIELSREQAFLTSFNDPDYSAQPFIRGTDAEPLAGYDVAGRTLIISLDGHSSLSDSEFQAGSNMPSSNNVTVTFAAAIPGERVTLDEVVDQINALFPGMASKHDLGGGSWVVQLQSGRFGAAASIIVRAQGTSNAGVDRLGFDVVNDTLAVGSGFYSDDDSDGDLVSPRLKIYGGSEQVTHDAYPGTPQTTSISPFLDASVEAGDSVIADGVLIGDIVQVESDILTMEVEQNIMGHDNPFAPRRVWLRANSLTFPAPASSTAAEEIGTVQTAPATSAYVVAQVAAEVGGVAVGPAESLDVNIVQDGVTLPTYTVSSGAGWTSLANIVDGINNSPDVPFEAYYANEYGEEVLSAYYLANLVTTFLGLRTLPDNRGSGSGLTVVSSTVAVDIGFTSLPLGDAGENIRFRPGTPAVFVSLAPVASFAGTETIAYEVTRAGTPIAPTETFTVAAAASLDLAVAAWNEAARHTEAYKSFSGGVEDVNGTYLSVRTRGENVGDTSSTKIELTTDGGAIFTAAAPETRTGMVDMDLDGATFKWSLDLNPKQYEVIFVKDEDDDGVSLQQVLDKINAETPNIASATSETPPLLQMQSNKVGEAAELVIVDGTANIGMGFTDTSANPVRGDGRPNPDMAINITGDLVLQSQLLRDGLTGEPYNPASAPTIVAYKALRLDLSPEADDPALLVIDDVESLELAASPISTDNPGSLMMFLSLINAPSVQVAGIGVPEVSDDAPEGTPLGYARCAEFLENEEVYALATASQLSTVHQTFMTHTNSMSEPEQKGERIYPFNPVIPDRALPDLLGSGSDANSTPNANEVIVEVNIAPALITAGLDPNAALNPLDGEIENEVYLDLAGDAKQYLVKQVFEGTRVVLRTTFEAGDGNDDAFYSSDPLPVGIISDDWTVAIRGERLLVPGTDRTDYQRVAETIQASAQGYGMRRGFYVHPDQVRINVSGQEQVVPGYYATACMAGMIGELPPQQGFTNYPVTGLTGVVGSSDAFTQRQLNVLAAGGVYILVHETPGAPVSCRHQLSTDMSSIEARELSITKVVDYVAKFMRAGLRNFIGKSNITQPFMDSLSTVIHGQLNFLVETAGVLNGADVNNVLQDADAPDTILIDVTLDVPFPANYLRLTLVI